MFFLKGSFIGRCGRTLYRRKESGCSELFPRSSSNTTTWDYTHHRAPSALPAAFHGMFLLFRSWATNKMHGPVDREEAVSNERMVSGRSRTRRGCTATFPQKQSPAKPQFNWNVSIQVQASSVHTTTILRIFEMFQNISVTALLKLLKVVIVGVKHYHTR
jgi:hypothetical protein